MIAFRAIPVVLSEERIPLVQSEPRQQHRLTRLGLHFLFVGTFSVLGGALRGLNLLLLLAGGLMAALLVQWRWSRRSIEVLSLRRRIPPEAFVGKPFRIRFRLTNHARFLPVWLLRVDDEIRPVDGGAGSMASTGISVVPAGRTQTPSYGCVVTRRGRYRLGPSSVVTSFPLCLMTSRLVMDDQVELDVYPRLLELSRSWRSRLLTRTEGAVASARRSGPAEGEFFGLREWQPGDHPRLIHWRTTARIGEPAVRQFEQQRRFDVCLLVDALRSPAAGRVPATRGEFETSGEAHEYAVGGEDEILETAISLAATLLVHLVATPSNRTILAVASRDAEAVIGGGSLEGKQRMLGLLARLEPSTESHLAEGLGRAIDVAQHPRDLIVVSTRSMQEAVARRSELSGMFQPWTRTGTLRWLNVSDPAVVRAFVKNPEADGILAAGNSRPTPEPGGSGEGDDGSPGGRHAD